MPRRAGFSGRCGRDGTPLVTDKRTYGQAFAIYALSEYALAAKSAWSREWAVKTLDVLVERVLATANWVFVRASTANGCRPRAPPETAKQ